MSSEPPEEPLSRSEYNTLSPASPKPIHLPTPTDIPILNMQTDVGFNQTEAHPALRNTETRPDMWQDPNEQPSEPAPEPTIDASPYSTGADALPSNGGEGDAGELSAQSVQDGNGVVEETATHNANLHPTPISNVPSNEGDVAPTVEASTANLQSIEPPTLAAGPDATVAGTSAVALPDAFSAQSDGVKIHDPTAQPDGGAVDIRGLLNTLAAAPPASETPVSANGLPTFQQDQTHALSWEQPNAPSAPGVGAGSSPLSASNLGVPPSGLPPRPPPQEQPLINPNYAHSQHIRDYHPHAAHSAYQPHTHSGSQGNTADPSSRSFVPPIGSPGAQSSNGVPPGTTYSPTTGGASGQGIASYATTPASAVPNFTPNQGTFPYQFPPATAGAAAGNNASRHAGRRPEDRPWDAEVQRKYDRFLDEERRYVAEGRWEQFPQGSRLFVGNLSSERVTKRDIFHVFHTYGELAQISIKQAYGFVQFLRAEDCVQALEAEEGTQIRDKKIHLEVSKPQKNRPQPQRRSRSPPDQRSRQGGSTDRYNGGRATNNRRDDYRPGRRSPSPRGYRDRYDDRYRRRSPSPPSYGGRGYGRNRSPTPRMDDGDDLPLPRRQPRDVPDVQIIVLDSLDRDFISWVEKAFSSRGVRVDVLLLSPRLPERAVVRRQIVEGVLAVVKLTRQNQNTGQIGLQIFDRSAGAGNVRFEEYDNLPPQTCAELVLREKSKVATPASSGGYGYQQQQQPQYGYPPQQGYAAPSQQPAGYPPNYNQPSAQAQQLPPPQGSVPPHLQSLITNLDPQNLQSLLSAMNTPQSAASNAYGGAPPQNSAVQALQQNPQLAGFLQQQQQAHSQPPAQQQPTGAGQVNMQDILARLGNGGGGR